MKLNVYMANIMIIYIASFIKSWFSKGLVNFATLPVFIMQISKAFNRFAIDAAGKTCNPTSSDQTMSQNW